MRNQINVDERLVQPLLSLSNSSSLEEALQNLVAAARTAEGRKRLASENILLLLLDILQSLTDSSAAQHLLQSLKLLRNLCAGEIANQDSFLERDGIQIVLTLLSSLENSDSSVVRIGLQLLGNVALAGPKHRRAVWSSFFPDGFVHLSRFMFTETIDPLCMIIYTCCDGCPGLIEELCAAPGLALLAEIVRTVSIVGFAEDWFKLIVSRTCLEGNCFPQLFRKLQGTCACEDGGDTDVKGEVFSLEQAFLLRIISEILNERIEEIMIATEFGLYVLGIFKRSIKVVDFMYRFKSGLPTGSVSVDVLGYSITILRDVCSQECLQDRKDDSVDVVDTLISSGLVEVLLCILGDLEPPAIIRKSLKQGEYTAGTTLSTSKVCPYRGFRRDIVAVIGNCAYRRTRVQDYLRQRDGILLLLQQCVTDEENPFLREWGIWCVRNVLEGNAENQKLVAELEVQGSVDVPELARLGLRVEVDQTTRRAKLVNVAGGGPKPD